MPFFGAFGAAGDDAMVARWSAHLLGMLWPEMDAAFVTSCGGNGGPSAATRRPVVSGLQTPRNRGILATLPTASGRCWIAGLCFTRSL